MNSSSKDFLTWKKLNNNECFCFLFFLLGRCSTFVRPNRKGLKSSHSSSFITWSLARDWSWHIMRSTQLIFFASFKPCRDTFVRNYSSSKDIIFKKSSFCVKPTSPQAILSFVVIGNKAKILLRDLIKDALLLIEEPDAWCQVDLNSGPLDYETVALTTSPTPLPSIGITYFLII